MNRSNKNHRENGQTLVIVAFSIVTLIAFIGLGVDLGLAYVEKVRVQRAADAAALAAAAELPLETAAQLRALEYLSENNYDCNIVISANNANCTAPDVYVKINNNETFPYDPDNPPDTKIEIDTASFADTQGNNLVPNSASRIQVKVTQRVHLYFMRLLGFSEVPVIGTATAENIKDLDVVLVFDKSGSMEFDTLCYGCWIPEANKEYPDGKPVPLRWDGAPDGSPYHCSHDQDGDGDYDADDGNGIKTINGDYYMVIEAEEYSRISNDYHRNTSPGQGYTYWVMQRNGKITAPNTSYLGDAGAYGRDTQGAYIAHFPYVTGYNRSGGAGVPCSWADLHDGYMCRRGDWITDRGGPYPAPRVDYDFTVPSDGSGSWYMWIRAQGGDRRADTNDGQTVFWGLTGPGYNNRQIIGTGEIDADHSNDNGWHDNGARSSYWTWRALGMGDNNTNSDPITLSPGDYTLHLWAGTPGFAIDRIIIAQDSSLPDEATQSGTSYLDNNRTDWACDPCDARFGGYPGGLGNTSGDGDDPPNCDATSGPGLSPEARKRYKDDLFDDEQPMASTAAAAVRFIRKLDFQFDQIGLVRYSSRADPDNKLVELLCLKSDGAGCTKDVIEDTIINKLMSTTAGGSTNIADGLEEAIQMMDNSPPHYGRPSAAHVIILMTDGQPNQYSGLLPENANCHAEDLWPGSSKAHDCAVFMAHKARNEGIIIYGITLGEGADRELLAAISEVTGGIHLHAEDPSRLDDIFNELYNRIFLRLVE